MPIRWVFVHDLDGTHRDECFDATDRRLISAGRKDGYVKVWDVATRTMTVSARVTASDLEGIALSPDGTTLAVSSGDGVLGLWDLATLAGRGSLDLSDVPLYGVTYSGDGKTLATCDGLGRLWLLDAATLKPRSDVVSPRSPGEHAVSSFAVSFLSGGRVLATAGDRGVLRLLDAVTLQPVADLPGHTDRIWNLSLSPDGTMFSTASADGSFKLWDVRPRPLERRFAPPLLRNSARHVATLSGDGRTLVAARAADGRVEVAGYDRASGEERFRNSPARPRWSRWP